jgi:transposase
MAQTTAVVGIDVSADWLDVVVLPDGDHSRVSNDAQGWLALRERLEARGVRAIGLEASGGYERGPIAVLVEAGLPVRLVNPLRLRQFARASGVLAKNDPLDARVLASFVATMPTRPARHDRQLGRLGELVDARRQVVEACQTCRNQLRLVTDRMLRRFYERRIRQAQDDTRQLDRRIAREIAAQPDLAQRCALLTSMPGAGPVLAANLIAFLPELGTLSNRKIGALVGVVPYDFDSGKLKGLRAIYGGRAKIRKVLYMAAQVAALHNPALRSFKQRLIAAGKKPKVAIVAVMRKMIVTLNAMARDNAPWTTA